MADDGELFRIDPTRMAVQMAVGFWLVGAVMLAAIGVTGGLRGLTLATFVIVGGQGVLAGVLHGLTMRRCGVRVGPAGLAVVAPLQADRWTRWDDIHTVRSRHVILVPQLVLTGPGVRLVLPFTFTDPDGFAEAVARHAGDDHPLAVAAFERLATG